MFEPDFWDELPEPPEGSPVEHPHATTVLLVGVMSVLCCGVLGPVAWVMGRRALDEIDISGGTVGGRSQVMIGYFAGIAGTVIMIITACIFLLTVVGGH
ncbi:MAG: DUF4190 domain-containing protein [Nocardia sp.]|nr:DUF4190 domain-containing protein [Nocardia sp.]